MNIALLCSFTRRKIRSFRMTNQFHNKCVVMKGPKKRLLHHFRWRRVLLLVFMLYAKRIIFGKSDKSHKLQCWEKRFTIVNDWEKRFYLTYIFYRSSSPILNNVKFQKSVFWALNYEILPNVYLKLTFNFLIDVFVWDT